MVLSTIAVIVLFYLLLMILIHEMFRKFFHMILFVSFVIFIAGALYLILRGG